MCRSLSLSSASFPGLSFPADSFYAAAANNAGGTVRLHLGSPQQARYVLIWFTLLPPNGAGQYQATIYHVVVNGHP